MTLGALLFMGLSWTLVLGLTAWCFTTIVRRKRHFDPDGIGPGRPPVPPAAADSPDAGPRRRA